MKFKVGDVVNVEDSKGVRRVWCYEDFLSPYKPKKYTHSSLFKLKHEKAVLRKIKKLMKEIV